MADQPNERKPEKGLNKVQVIGRLGADPEMRYTQSGQPVTSIRMGASKTWKDGQGATQSRTEWFNVEAWRKLAEIMNQYLGKGDRIYLEGELQTDHWTDTEGKDHWKTKVVANEMIMLSTKGGQRTGETIANDAPAEETVIPF